MLVTLMVLRKLKPKVCISLTWKVWEVQWATLILLSGDQLSSWVFPHFEICSSGQGQLSPVQATQKVQQVRVLVVNLMTYGPFLASTWQKIVGF